MTLEDVFRSTFVGGCALALGGLVAACQPVVVVGDGSPEAGSVSRSGEQCGVQTVLSGLQTPLAVAYADQSVFAIDAGPSGDFRLLRTPLAGGAPIVLEQGNGASFGLWARGYFAYNSVPFAADANGVYWVGDDGGLLRTPVNGGATKHLFTPQNQALDHVTSIALDDTNVYWASNGSILRMPLAGGPQTTLHTPTTPVAVAMSVVVDSSSVYWLADDEAVLKMPLSGGPATHLLDWGLFELTPRNLALRGDDLFLVNWGAGYTWSPDMKISGTSSVLRLSSVAASAPEVLASNLPGSTAIAIGPDGAYFGGGKIDGDARYWAPVQHVGANGVVVDIDPKAVVDNMVACDGGVCWTDATSGTVKRYVPCESAESR